MKHARPEEEEKDGAPAKRPRLDPIDALDLFPAEVWDNIIFFCIPQLQTAFACRAILQSFERLHYGPLRRLTAMKRLQGIQETNRRFFVSAGAMPTNQRGDLISWIARYVNPLYGSCGTDCRDFSFAALHHLVIGHVRAGGGPDGYDALIRAFAGGTQLAAFAFDPAKAALECIKCANTAMLPIFVRDMRPLPKDRKGWTKLIRKAIKTGDINACKILGERAKWIPTGSCSGTLLGRTGSPDVFTWVAERTARGIDMGDVLEAALLNRRFEFLDWLTGVYNRTFSLKMLAREVPKIVRYAVLNEEERRDISDFALAKWGIRLTKESGRS